MRRDSIDAVMARLDPFLDDFDAIPRKAHAAYRSYKPKHLIELSPRSQANCIYDHMVAEAERRFDNRKMIRPLDIRGLKLWVFEEHTVARFKKMDEDGRTRNYPTQQARDFDLNRELDGVPPKPIRITVGYLLDPSGTMVQRVQIARPNGKFVDWCAAIVPSVERITGGKIWEDVTKQPRFGT
jgi:hypothetical protein